VTCRPNVGAQNTMNKQPANGVYLRSLTNSTPSLFAV